MLETNLKRCPLALAGEPVQVWRVKLALIAIYGGTLRLARRAPPAQHARKRQLVFRKDRAQTTRWAHDPTRPNQIVIEIIF